MHNDLQVNQPALIINVEQEKNIHLIGTSTIVLELLSIEESKKYFRDTKDQPYAFISLGGLKRGVLQRYLMPIPPLDDQTEIESKLILTPEKEKCLQQ